MLEIKNLNVSVENNIILENINLFLEQGKTIAIVGPNGSGKSTFLHSILGNPKYKTTGTILFNNQDISELSTYERAKLGIFLSFQNPPEIPGVSTSYMLKNVINEQRKTINEKPIDSIEFLKKLKSICSMTNIPDYIHSRHINHNFSGGEKKLNEILQMIVLNPKLILLDEIDSGLDIDKLKIVQKVLNDLKKLNKSIILVSHQFSFLKDFNPDIIFKINNKCLEIVNDLTNIEEKGFNNE